MLHEQAGEPLLSIGSACGLYEHIQTWLYLGTAGTSSRGPFQCFYPVLGDVFAACTDTCGTLIGSCLTSAHCSKGIYKTSAATPHCEAGRQLSLKISMKCRGSDPDHSVSGLESLGKQYLLSCFSLSHLMGDGILHFFHSSGSTRPVMCSDGAQRCY